MDIDDAGSNPPTMGIDAGSAGRCREAPADGRDPTIDDQEISTFQAFTRAREDRRTLDQHRSRDRRLVGRGVGLIRESRRYAEKSAAKSSQTRKRAHRRPSP